MVGLWVREATILLQTTDLGQGIVSAESRLCCYDPLMFGLCLVHFSCDLDLALGFAVRLIVNPGCNGFGCLWEVPKGSYS